MATVNVRGSSSAGLAWIGAIREPSSTLHWSLGEWERVVRLGRRLRLLARLAESVDEAGLIGAVPAEPRRHLVAEQRASRHRTAAMVWALERVRDALGPSEGECVLLKGAAYLGQDLPIATGRLPSDVDILVPPRRIASVQQRLAAAGWVEVDLDEYDRRYYAQWSHEVPPLVHPIHPMELDLHHGLLPPTARNRVDTDVLLPHLTPSKWAGWQVLQPVDQVLHCASHLFFDSDVRNRVRDLVDLDGLFRHFGSDPSFWGSLAERARALGLSEPLALASHFCVAWLATPIPEAAQREFARCGPSSVRRQWLVPLLATLLNPTEPDSSPSSWQGVAGWIFLVRYQYWRMPMRLLLPHLLHKARLRQGAASPDRSDKDAVSR